MEEIWLIDANLLKRREVLVREFNEMTAQYTTALQENLVSMQIVAKVPDGTTAALDLEQKAFVTVKKEANAEDDDTPVPVS